MARYTPATPTGDLSQFLFKELGRIAQAMETANEVMNLDTLYAAPKKFREGTIAKADGTSWNPGSGAGVYCYRGGAWRFLG